MKRSICIAKGSTVTAVAVCLLMVAAVSAVLVMMDSRSNRFSTGENISKIEEHFKLHNRMYPDSDYEKKMWVRNTGDVPCYVRVFAEVQDPDIREKLEIDYNTSDWSAKQPDGYYYYNRILAVGESTEPLFTTLHPTDELDSLNIICYRETVQSDGASSALDAFGYIN